MNRCEEVLIHHGIKGMKWGVRRYQDKNGRLTAEGRKRQNLKRKISEVTKTTDAANDIVRTLSKTEKQKLGASLHEDWIEKEVELETSSNLTKRFLQKYGDKPVSFLEVWDNGGTTGQIALATHKDYRGQGLAAKNTEALIKWFDRYGNKKLNELEWIARKDNPGSIAIAKEYGFVLGEKPDTDDWKDYDRYVYKTKN